MKTKAIVFLCAVGIFFSSFKTIDQELKTAVVIYDGYERRRQLPFFYCST